MMLNSQRIFVDAVKKYCAAHGIGIEIRSQGWLIIMQRGPRRHLAFGYDVGLNSAVAHRIANDKAATAEVLQACGVACVPHTLFLSPEMNEYIPPQRSWEAMLALLRENPDGIVVKPNEGTSGDSVFKVTSRARPRACRAPDLFFQPRSCGFALSGDRKRGARGPARSSSAGRLRQEPPCGHGRRQALAAGAGAGGDARGTAIDGVAGHARRSRSRRARRDRAGGPAARAELAA